jgi:hypothetical protein
MKRTALASLFALALATGAAQAHSPIGGGSATISGGGDDMVITYSTGGAGGGMALHSQSGRLARFAATDGDGPVVQYSAPADTNPGREAWLIGGGDNAEVVYDRR